MSQMNRKKKTKNDKKERLDLAQIRARLSEADDERYWRSLEELAETEEFQEFLNREFPREASGLVNSVNRREFLKLMAASLALAGLSACGGRGHLSDAPTEKIVPYVKQPEEIIPGKPLFFATAMTFGGIATGLLVKSNMGRPIKIEGNPDHPASLGATDTFAQASVLTLYDPDRSQAVTNLGRVSTWDSFLASLISAMEGQHARRGAGLRILTETVTSPTLADQMQNLLKQFPLAKWHQYDPVGRDNVFEGSRLAFGGYVNTNYRLDKADVILALDSDFLSHIPGSLRYAWDFSSRRRVESGQSKMNRLYVVESTPTITGVAADHRLPLRASEIETFARALAQELGVKVEPMSKAEADNLPDHRSTEAVPGSSAELTTVSAKGFTTGRYTDWVSALVRDLQSHRGSSVVLAGDWQPPVVHTLAHAMNHALDNIGTTVIYTDPVEVNPVNQTESLRELVGAMGAGLVDVLVIIDSNPVFTAPADLRFSHALSKARLRIHLGLYDDETAALCHWHIPKTHYLESWSDARAYDGTVTIVQPLIAPLYGGKSVHELIAAVNGEFDRSGYDIVHDYWRGRAGSSNEGFERFWKTMLHDGLITDTALPPKAVSLKTEFDLRGLEKRQGAPRPNNNQDSNAQNLEIIFRPDPNIWDGRFANNGWLQELPKPLTKLTWDNAALISPNTADRLGLANENVVELRYGAYAVNAPVWIMPGHPDDSVTVYLGYGRTRAGRVGTGRGFNAYAIRTSGAPWFNSGLQTRKVGSQYKLVSTQHHHSMEGRDLIRVGTIGQFQGNPDFARKKNEELRPPSLYPEYKYEGYAWGMAIDLNTCIGCNACVVACQAENNIPVVGKYEVARGREMQWLRIDRYYKGNWENPENHFQPVLCMHCENAPCEVVCPVGATVHSSEGLNEMVYNRCIGTRYCSNNCPYKVRRFNFFQFADYQTPSLKLLNNPDVTVRSRGVMEKCTYCVQRINAARIKAEEEDRKIRDGDIITACQAACPTEAIVFGDINDSNSRVSKLKAKPLNYGLLTELNTRPRTTYMAKIKNPNPEIKG